MRALAMEQWRLSVQVTKHEMKLMAWPCGYKHWLSLAPLQIELCIMANTRSLSHMVPS